MEVVRLEKKRIWLGREERRVRLKRREKDLYGKREVRFGWLENRDKMEMTGK